jgi:uncharacterized protein
MDMDLQTAKLAIDLFPADQPFKIQLAGGEPLLNTKLIEEICAYAYSKPNFTTISLQTNATLIDESFIKLLKRFRISVGISLDAKPLINDKVRGKSTQALAGAQKLAAAGIMTNINTVITNVNAPYLSGLIDVAIYLGNVQSIGFDMLRQAGRTKQTDVAAPTTQALYSGLREFYEKLEKVGYIGSRQLDKLKAFPGSDCAYCYASLGRSYTVLPNGDVYPCGSLSGLGEYSMGNVHTRVSPKSLSVDLPAKCKSCSDRKACASSCPSRNILNGYEDLACVMTSFSKEFIN